MPDFLASKIIKASAGTGKTQELANRIIALLNSGCHPENLLATTFTRKAAGEIIDRLFNLLSRAAKSQEYASQLSKQIDSQSFNSAVALKLIGVLTKSIHRLHISTLDSLYSELARSFSNELGLPADWRFADEAESYKLRNVALYAMLADENSDSLLDILASYNLDHSPRSVTDTLEKLLEKLELFARITDQDSWRLSNLPIPVFQDQIDLIIDKLNELVIPKTKKDNKENSNWKKARVRLILALKSKDLKAIFDNTLVSNVIAEDYNYSRAIVDENWQVVIKELHSAAASLWLHKISEKALATARLVKVYDSYYSALRASRQQLGFSDLKDLLSQASVASQIDDLYYRLDSRFNHILLDEFQDTSVSDWKIIHPIIAELRSQAGADKSFFCVGDQKQAIYSWRGGTSKLFDLVEHYWLGQAQVLSKNNSYRSAKDITEFVNQVFRGFSKLEFQEQFQPAINAWLERFEEQISERANLGYVELTRIETEDDSLEDYVRERVLWIQKHDALSEIGILVRTNGKVEEYVNYLRECGIAASQEGGNPLAQAKIIKLIINFLVFCEHPFNTIARYTVAKSILGKVIGYTNYKDDSLTATITTEFNRLLYDRGYGEAMLFLKSKLDPEISAEERFKLTQLVELASDYQHDTTRTEPFIERLKRTKVSEPGSERVRVMTIHASKGLEFDHVILPEIAYDTSKDLNKGFWYSVDSTSLEINKISFACARNNRGLNQDLKKTFEATTDRLTEEALNLLYVAMTRARLSLFIPINSKKFTGSLNFAKQIDLVFQSQWQNCQVKLGSFQKSNRQQQERIVKYYPDKVKLKTSKYWTRTLPVREPSDLEILAKKSVESVLNYERDSQLVYGSSVHQLLERVCWLEDFSASFWKDINTPEDLKLEVLGLINQPNIKELLSKNSLSAHDFDVRREYRIIQLMDDYILNGVIDRLVITKSEQEITRIEVIDLKTDQKINPENYYKQIEAYRLAVAQNFNITSDKVVGKIVFLKSDQIFEA